MLGVLVAALACVGSLEAADSASIVVLSANPSAVEQGGRVDFSVRVTNTGTTTWEPIGSTFSATPSADGGIPYPQQMGYYYLNLQFLRLDDPSPFASPLFMVVPLPSVLSPGQSATVSSYFYSPSATGRWAASVYVVRVWAFGFLASVLNSAEEGYSLCPGFEFDVDEGTPTEPPCPPVGQGEPWTIAGWTETTPVPETAYWTTALAFNGRVLFLLVTGQIYVGQVSPDGSISGWVGTLGMPRTETNMNGAVIVRNRLVIPSRPTSMIGSLNDDGTVSGWVEGPGISSPATDGRVSVVNGNRIYTLGGAYPYWQMVDLVETAELLTDGSLSPWQPTTSLVAGIGPQDPMAMVHDDHLYVFGGETGNGDLAYSSNVHRAPILADGFLGEWEYSGSLTIPRPHSAFLSHGGSLHLVGGGVHSYMTAEVESVLVEELGVSGAAVRSEPLPTARNQPGTAVVGRFGYVIGGNTCAFGGCNPTNVLVAELGPDDPDGDGVCGIHDNCPETANPSQEDGDGDGVGDACDGSYSVVLVIRDEYGHGVPGGRATPACGGSWQPMLPGETDANGELPAELPLCFTKVKMEVNQGSVQQTRAEMEDSNFTWRTEVLRISLDDHAGSAITDQQGVLDQGGGYWYRWGNLNGSGFLEIPLFPRTQAYEFRMSYNHTTQELYPVVAVSAGTDDLHFRTGGVHDTTGACIKWATGSWSTFTQDMEVLPGTYRFVFPVPTGTITRAITAGAVNSIP